MPEYLVSPLLDEAGFRHAFFTRRGGVSAGAYASLNFSVAVGDVDENVRRNLGLAARALAVDPDRLCFASQVHGREAVVLRGDATRERVLEEHADAVLSRAPEIACAVRTADCVPVLIGDTRSGAAAAIHAGWRGAVAGVVEAGVSELRKLIGGEGELVAAIGPHISREAFEVAEDVARDIARAAGDPAVVERRPGARPRADLRRTIRLQMNRLGLGDASIEDVGGCTVGEPELYFSYRRDGKRSGRHLAAIVPR